MSTEEQYNIIEAYLAGNMTEAERVHFEQTMDAEPALAADVQLHRELALTFSDPAYISMRKTLDDVDKEFRTNHSEPKSKSTSNGLWLLAGLGVILILGMWFWPMSSYEEQKSATPQLSPLPTPSDTILNKSFPKEMPSPSNLESTGESKERLDPFKPNPTLERAMTMPGNAYYAIKDGKVEHEGMNGNSNFEIRFHGLLVSALDPPSMQLEFLNNRLPNGTVMYRLPVEVNALKVDENIRAFGGKKTWYLTAKQEINLSPGLYYQRLVITSDQQVLWWSKSVIQ